MISDQKQWPKNDSPEKNPFVKNCQNMIAFKKKKKKKKTCEKRLHLPKNQLISIKGKHIYYYPMHKRVLFQFINYYPRVRQNLLFHKYIDISKMNTKSLIHVMLGQINISLNIKKHLDIVNIFFKVDLI